MDDRTKRCPECDGLHGSLGEAGADGAAVCATCGRALAEPDPALLRLLTQLANCGLTAAAPPVLPEPGLGG